MARVYLNGQSEKCSAVPWVCPNPFLLTLKSFYFEVESKIPWTDSAPTLQSGIQTCALFPDDLLKACGAVSELPMKEQSFNQIPKFYWQTPIRELLESLPFKVSRLRWMKLLPKSCYTVHFDSAPRIHIPLVTSPDAYFAFPNEGFVNLAEGGLYVVDTTKEHTFLNGGLKDRVHIVGVVDSEVR